VELKHLNEIERATKRGRNELFRIGMALLFIVGVMLYAGLRGDGEFSLILVVAAMIGGYMAMNIGANDVANNVGPAVGSKALTLAGALVSTTHSIVGAVLGAGIAAGGWNAANWDKMSAIAASWIISPLLGGLIAAGFLYLVKRIITYQQDMSAAAGMAWVFAAYLILKGLGKIWKIEFFSAVLIGLGRIAAAWIITVPASALMAAVLFYMMRGMTM